MVCQAPKGVDGHSWEVSMIVMDGEEFLTAQEACTILGIKAATLYAYVSRGLLKSYRQGIKRMRLYRRDDVEELTRLRDSSPRESDQSRTHRDDDAWIRYV
jgi:excisionase family DNA binding protein